MIIHRTPNPNIGRVAIVELASDGRLERNELCNDPSCVACEKHPYHEYGDTVYTTFSRTMHQRDRVGRPPFNALHPDQQYAWAEAAKEVIIMVRKGR